MPSALNSCSSALKNKPSSPKKLIPDLNGQSPSTVNTQKSTAQLSTPQPSRFVFFKKLTLLPAPRCLVYKDAPHTLQTNVEPKWEGSSLYLESSFSDSRLAFQLGLLDGSLEPKPSTSATLVAVKLTAPQASAAAGPRQHGRACVCQLSPSLVSLIWSGTLGRMLFWLS